MEHPVAAASSFPKELLLAIIGIILLFLLKPKSSTLDWAQLQQQLGSQGLV